MSERDPDDWPLWLVVLIFVALLLGVLKNRRDPDEF